MPVILSTLPFNKMKICMNLHCENESLKNNDYCYGCCRRKTVIRKPVQLYEIINIDENENVDEIEDLYIDPKVKFVKHFITFDTYERIYK